MTSLKFKAVCNETLKHFPSDYIYLNNIIKFMYKLTNTMNFIIRDSNNVLIRYKKCGRRCSVYYGIYCKNI